MPSAEPTMYEQIKPGAGYCGVCAHDFRRAVLKAMRDPTREVRDAGITPKQWRETIDLMLQRADEIDAAEVAREVEDRHGRWAAIQAKLTAEGANVLPTDATCDRWVVEFGNQAVVDLVTGDVVYDYCEPSRGLAYLVANVVRRTAELAAAKAERDRVRRLRATHVWSRGSWWPKDGVGAPIRGGRSAPHA